ncbi:MAG: hypothetical protein ACK5UM_15325 [Pseudomonadota bacterium]|jgi:hypothetical protein|nr:hypothetical protein [Rubrivivax sp.]MCZ8031730.1 hypothetical protein [Rubrivivax sp.]
MDSNRRDFLRHALAASSAALTGASLTACSVGTAATGSIAPDLEDGYIVFNAGGNSGGEVPDNVWVTAIESALQRRVGSTLQSAYLGKECRAEGLGRTPFEDRENYEFVGARGWDGNYLFRHGLDVPPEYQYQRVTQDAVDRGFTFDVHAAARPTQQLDFAEVLAMLQRRSGPMRRLYAQLSYRLGEEDFILFTRCRYINLPHASNRNEPYLQPISGRVLLWQDERLHLAYVVFHLRRGAVEGMHFKRLDRAEIGIESNANDFVRTVTVDPATARCSFFCYEA